MYKTVNRAMKCFTKKKLVDCACGYYVYLPPLMYRTRDTLPHSDVLDRSIQEKQFNTE